MLAADERATASRMSESSTAFQLYYPLAKKSSDKPKYIIYKYIGK